MTDGRDHKFLFVDLFPCMFLSRNLKRMKNCRYEFWEGKALHYPLSFILKDRWERRLGKMHSKLPKTINWPSPAAYICNCNTLRGWGGRITWAQEFETRLGNIMGSHIYKKTKNKTKQTGTVVHICSPSYLGGWGGRITSAWEVKAAVNQSATALQTGWQSETLSQK